MIAAPAPALPDIEIDVALACTGWRQAFVHMDPPGDIETLCRAAVAAALAGAGWRGPAEVSLLLADNAMVHDLNRDHRGKDRATNVLSFPGGAEPPPAGAPVLLGDVVLALETVLGEAGAEGKAPADHLAHLLVHGVLHLLGHDHEDSAEAERMEALETEILARMGIADPYAGSGDLP